MSTRSVLFFAPRRLCAVFAGAVFAAASPAGAAPDLRFGAQSHFAQGWSLSWAPLIAQSGVGGVRDEIYWSSVELSPGQYGFASFDPYMAELKACNLSPLIELDFANPLYDGGQTPYDAAGFNAYSAYCTQVLQHYGSQITAVEIWNEYDGGFCSGPAANDRPASYTQMLEAAYPAIKALRPDVTVAAGSTSWMDLGFFQQIFADGALPFLDVLSCHPYRFNQAPEGLENDIASLQTLTRLYNNGQAKPIWVTEIGWYPHTAVNSNDITIDDTTEAEFVIRSYALLLSAGVQRVYWYLSRDNPEIDNGQDLGLMAESLTSPLKPATLAMENMTGQLAGASFVRREGAPNSTYSLLFQRTDGTQVRVLWATSNATLPSTGATAAFDFEGNSVALNGSFAVTGSPLFVIGPWTGLPDQGGTVLASTVRDFGGVQGTNGWSYGTYFGNTTFTPAPTFQLPATSAPAWTNSAYPWLSITAGDQLPSWGGVYGATQVSAVRRWTSSYSGTVEIIGRFQTEQVGGDGVGVSVVVDGVPQFRQLIGTGFPSTTYAFDISVAVQVGSTIDFAVDPGPSTDNTYDATAIQAWVVSVPPAPVPPAPAPAISPAPVAETLLTDSRRDFGGVQGGSGWTYGNQVGGAGFTLLPTYASGVWSNRSHAYLTISQADQHPSYIGATQLAADRRWTSAYAGTVEIAGAFTAEQAGVAGGDGVGVSVIVNGVTQFRQLIGTGHPLAAYSFDLFVPVEVGTPVDFVVDPGPGTNMDYDATALSATISSTPVLADPARDFSGIQGGGGWSYGASAAGGTFAPLPAYSAASGQWSSSALPWLSITRGDQHPSYSGGAPVSAVRRWTSNASATVEVSGQFLAEQAGVGGDGVGVSVLVNGVPEFRQLIGTGQPAPSYSFDFTVPVVPGTTIDFALDPGPAANIDYDATALSATIKLAP